MLRLDLYVKNQLQASVSVAPETVIGRDVSCLVQIPDPKVSRRHAIITQEGDGYVVRHVGTNPTQVNGLDVEDTAPLNFGDVIFISDYILAFQSDDSTPAIAAATVYQG